MKISEIIMDKYKLRVPPTVYYDLLDDVLEAEEEQEPRWIPVSEYLPVTNDEVLVTYIVNGNAKKRYVETANCFDGEWSSVNDEYRIPNTKIEIIAWMPLPEPYKAESEEYGMTNGEKMQADFPDIKMWGESKATLDYSLGGMIHRVTKSWWNAEYKELNKSEKPTSSQELIKKIGYKGCKNCQHKIEPLRMCKWAEHGGDGHLHFSCPKWDKRGEEV